MAHAEGYVDCLDHFYRCHQTYTNQNKNSYTEEHEKMLQEHRKKEYGQDVEILFDSMGRVLKTLEAAYEAGWDEKLLELEKNHVGD
jgi:hypothetical protein